MRMQLLFTVALALAFFACTLVIAWAQYTIARYTRFQGASPQLSARLNEVESNVAGVRRQLVDLDQTLETRFKSLYGRLGGRPRRPPDSDGAGDDEEVATATPELAARLAREMAAVQTPNGEAQGGVTWAGGYPIFRR